MVQDLEKAEVGILKLVQTNAFDKEVKTLKEFQAQTEGVHKDRQCVKKRKAPLKKTGSIPGCYQSASSRRLDNEGKSGRQS